MKTEGSELAYPYTEVNSDGSIYHENKGLTKREYFAAMAMQGMVSGVFTPEGFKGGTPRGLADLAVELADHLIEALNDNP